MSLSFACDAAKILGIQAPPSWAFISQKLKISQDLSRDIHLEYDGYNGNTIKQADVILLGYPLMFPMTQQRKKNNLVYYSQRTDKGGPAMTFSMETIGWMELGILDQALSVWPDAYANAQKPFLVWTETAHPPGGAVNFITGAGGFLQGILAGFGGIRLTADRMTFSPKLLNPVTAVKLNQIFYQNNTLEISFDKSSTTITLINVETTAPALQMVDSTGQAHPLVLGKPQNLALGEFYVSKAPKRI